MKPLKSILAVLLCLTIVVALCIPCFAAPETDGVDAEFMYKLYITDMLYNDMITSGKSRDELLEKRADELGLSDIRAYEIELECGLHPVIYTKDELPLPSTTATEPAETETTPITTVEPTEITTTPSASAPVDNVTEPSEPANTSTSETEDQETGTNRYYFYKPGYWLENEYSDTVGIDWWDDNTNAPSAWPGYEAKKADFEGVYYYDVPKDVTTIIWNNFVDDSNSETDIYQYLYQTKNIPTEYYDPGECVLYPNGTESFDGMIFICNGMVYSSDYSVLKNVYIGEWYYYYGNGEYGITPKKSEDFYSSSFLTDVPDSDEFDKSIIPIFGDVNIDSKLNIKDATIIQKYIAMLWAFDKIELYLADINKDFVINIKDATTIQKKLANII